MVKVEIDRLETIITSSGIIENFAGLCVHKVENGVYIGYTLDPATKENLNGMDDRYSSSAYLHLLPPSIDPVDRNVSLLKFDVALELFATPKKLGYQDKYFQKALEVYQLLKIKKYDIVMTSRDHEKLELSTITIRFEKHVGCNYVPDYLTPIVC